MKRQITKRVVNENNKRRDVENVWMHDRIRNEIKLRRQYNREKRHLTREEKWQSEEKYRKQKELVQPLIMKVKNDHEEKTEQIKESKDCNEKIYEMINKLRGRDRKNDKQEAKLFEDDGVEINRHLIYVKR